MWWLYKNLEDAQAALVIINNNIHALNPNIDFLDAPYRLTANPIIDNEIYLYGFEKPGDNISQGASCDLETQYNQEWFAPPEI